MEVSQDIENYEVCGEPEIIVECFFCGTIYNYADFKYCHHCGTKYAMTVWISEKVKLK